MGMLIGLIVLAIVVAGLLWMSIAAVPEGMHFTVERMGQFQRVLTPGRRLVLPFLERVGARIDMRENLLVLPPQDVMTMDGVRAVIHLNVGWQVLDVAKAAYEVNDHPTALQSLITETLRRFVASRRLADLQAHRQIHGEEMRQDIDARARSWGLTVRELDIADIVVGTPPAAT